MRIKAATRALLKSPFRMLFPSTSETSLSLCSTSVFFPTGSDAIERDVFAFFDKNGDGKISSAELHSCIRSLGSDLSKEDAEAAISFSDTDGDGFLSVDDFRLLMEDSTCGTEELKQAFELYSTKPGSGCISPRSLKRMMSRLGESKSIDDCKAMIRSFDLNGDGLLTFDEFSIMMNRGVPCK